MQGLYGLPTESQEALNRRAHPGGGTETMVVESGEGLVEDQFEAHLKGLYVAYREPTAGRLAVLASALEEIGEENLAEEVDDVLADFYEVELVKSAIPAIPGWAEGVAAEGVAAARGAGGAVGPWGMSAEVASMLPRAGWLGLGAISWTLQAAAFLELQLAPFQLLLGSKLEDIETDTKDLIAEIEDWKKDPDVAKQQQTIAAMIRDANILSQLAVNTQALISDLGSSEKGPTAELQANLKRMTDLHLGLVQKLEQVKTFSGNENWLVPDAQKHVWMPQAVEDVLDWALPGSFNATKVHLMDIKKHLEAIDTAAANLYQYVQNVQEGATEQKSDQAQPQAKVAPAQPQAKTAPSAQQAQSESWPENQQYIHNAKLLIANANKLQGIIATKRHKPGAEEKIKALFDSSGDFLRDIQDLKTNVIPRLENGTWQPARDQDDEKYISERIKAVSDGLGNFRTRLNAI